MQLTVVTKASPLSSQTISKFIQGSIWFCGKVVCLASKILPIVTGAFVNIGIANAWQESQIALNPVNKISWASLPVDFLKARFRFLLVRWSVGKQTFLACNMLILTGQFSGRRCDRCVLLGMSNQETLHLVTSVLWKLDPGESMAWNLLLALK